MQTTRDGQDIVDPAALSAAVQAALPAAVSTAVAGAVPPAVQAALPAAVTPAVSSAVSAAVTPAVAAAVPDAVNTAISSSLSTAMPVGEGTAAAPGTSTKITRDDHKHPRLTSTTLATLDSNGLATVTFTRTFSAKPGVVMTEIDSSATQPLVMVVQSFVMTSGVYTGAVIKGYRSQVMPAQTTSLTLASLLTAVITTVNALAASLNAFNPFGGSAAGASVSVVAIARSDV